MIEKGKLGRPPRPGSWYRIHLYVEKRTLTRLRRLGGGSQTKGLHVLLRRYDKLRTRKHNGAAAPRPSPLPATIE